MPEKAQCPEKDSSKESRFLDWLVANGADLTTLTWPGTLADLTITRREVRTCELPRGVYTSERRTKDQVIMTIPERCFISEDMVMNHADYDFIYAAFPPSLRYDDPILSLFLMSERLRGSASFYAPYLEILPQEPDTPIVGTTWTHEALEACQDPQLVKRVGQRLGLMQSIFHQLRHICQETQVWTTLPWLSQPDDFTFELFSWAWAIIQSRSFGRRLPYTALVPFADCLNHGNVNMTYDYDHTRGVFTMTCGQALGKGAQVLNSYGRKSNTELLMDYGFVLGPENEWNVLDLALPTLYSTLNCRLGWRPESGKALLRWARGGGSPKVDEHKALLRALEALAQVFPTTLAQDRVAEIDSSGPQDDPKLPIAWAYRRGQKTLLAFHQTILQCMIHTNSLDHKSLHESRECLSPAGLAYLEAYAVQQQQ